MKRITLKDYAKPDKSSLYIDQRMYSVSLFSGQRATFTSRCEVEAFLVEINYKLNECLFELVETFTSVQAEFWKLWLYMDGGSNYTSIESKCKFELQAITEFLDRAVSGFHNYNGGWNVINQLLRAIRSLEFVIKQMSEIRMEKRDSLEVKRFNLVEANLNRVKFNLENICDIVKAELAEKAADQKKRQTR